MKYYESMLLYEKFYVAALMGNNQSPDIAAQVGVLAYKNFQEKLKTPVLPDVLVDSLKISSRLQSIFWNAALIKDYNTLDVKKLASLSRTNFEDMRNMGPKTLLELDRLFKTLNITYS